MAADVSASLDHAGRAGWSWYTGSASWMYRLMIESLLGIRLEGSSLHISPCLPRGWTNITIDYRYRETTYNIKINQIQSGDGAAAMTSDGVACCEAISLVNDCRSHLVEIRVPMSA
jgi:cellobiose phosphorylase